MRYELFIDERAEQDIRDAFYYYEEQAKGLGGKFEQSLQKCLERISFNPFFQIRYNNVRCLPLSGFPYMLHFSTFEKEKMVIVWAVFHTSRKPVKLNKK